MAQVICRCNRNKSGHEVWCYGGGLGAREIKVYGEEANRDM